VLHLKCAAGVYDELAQAPNWVTIECFDSRSGKLRSPEEIHRDLLEAVDARVLSRVG
jgi:hypothetical protein